MTRIRTTLALASISIAVLAVAGCGSDTAAPPAVATATIAVGSTSTEQSVTAEAPATTVATAAPASSAASTCASAPAAAVAVDPAEFIDRNGSFEVVGWKTPSGNIYCKLADSTLESGCQSSDAPIGEATDCVTPSFTIDQLSKGFVITPDSVEAHCFNQGIFGITNPKTLAYDQSITFKGFTCTSRTTGMSCVNGTGHGFVLSMQEARSF